MKRTIKIFVFLFIAIISYFSFTNINAKNDLDRINNYEIIVDPNFEDGSLDIKINITWTVLDSDSEGPLEWVKIGVPNWHATNIKGLTNNIGKIKYYSDDGSFIRIDFTRKYYKGETLDFSFSFNQSYMYHISEDIIHYDYNPGYFNDIIVDNCTLKWSTKNVSKIWDSSLAYEEVDGYYVYKSRLSYGEYIKIKLDYNKNVFTTIDPEKTYTSDSEQFPWLMPVIIISAVVLFFGVVVLINRITRDPYKSERGFYGNNYWVYSFFPRTHPYYRNGGVTKEGKPINPPSNVGGGHGGGCACACACAGGGRAGCSMKDFYHTNLDSNKVKETLDNINRD